MSENKAENDVTSSKDRANRLRRLRNLANLSRKELCSGADVNVNTYIGYEVGKYGGITKKSAIKIIDYLATQGVVSSLEWLLFGIGKLPQVFADLPLKTPLPLTNSLIKNEMAKIKDEIDLFHFHYEQAIDFQVNDEAMLPKYANGDYVAGIQKSGQAINQLLGLDCIVQTLQGETLLRTLLRGSKDSYTLVCSNEKSTTSQSILPDVTLKSAAAVCWHRRTILNND